MKQKLKVGTIAPGFSVTDINGQTAALDNHGQEYVLVAFLRYAGCPWCNLAIHRLTMEMSLLQEQDCSIIAFVQSSKQNIIENIYKRHAKPPTFPVIADRHRQVYGQYAVRPSLIQSIRHVTNIPHWVHAVRREGYRQSTIDGNLFLAPALFLVSATDRIVVRADYNANLYEHGTFSQLYEAMARHKLQAGR